MGNHVNRYTQIVYSGGIDIVPIRAFIQGHKELTSGMGELHNHIFSIINQNGYTYSDITGTPREWTPVTKGTPGSGDAEGGKLR
jgi:hypothetical protein